MPFDSVRLWQSSKRWFRLAGCRSRPWVEASLGPAAPKHGIKRVDRLLGNRHLWAERWLIFDSMIWCVLRGGAWRRHRAIRVAADNPGGLGTQAVGDQRVLVAAVPIGGRALTLYFEVHPERRLGNTKVQTRFLRALRDLLPPGCRPVIVTGCWFPHGPFFRDVRRLGWDFVGRLRGTAKARPVEGGPAISKDEFYARASLVPRALGSFDLYTSSQERPREPGACPKSSKTRT